MLIYKWSEGRIENSKWKDITKSSRKTGIERRFYRMIAFHELNDLGK